MITIERLQMIDFRSYKDESISFVDLPDETLILGEVLDAPGVDSNGAGKSTIPYAICWTLFGKWDKELKVDDVIRFGQKAATVILKIINSAGETGVIERTRPFTGSQTLLLTIDGEERTGNTPTQTQDNILEFLDLTKGFDSGKRTIDDFIADFQNAVMFSTESMNNFAGSNMTNEQRMAALARFLRLTVIDECKKLSAGKRTEANRLMNAVRASVENLEREGAALGPNIEEELEQAKLVDAANNTEVEIAEEVVEKVQEVMAIKNALDRVELQIEQLEEAAIVKVNNVEFQVEKLGTELELSEIAKEEKKRLMAMIQPVDTEEMGEIKEGIETLRKIREGATSNKNTVSRLKTELKKQLEEVFKCPACDAALMFLDLKIQLADPDSLSAKFKESESELVFLSEKERQANSELTELLGALKASEQIQDENARINQGIAGKEVIALRGPKIEKEIIELGISLENIVIETAHAKKLLDDKLLELQDRARASNAREVLAQMDQFKEDIFELRRRAKASTEVLATLKAKKVRKGNIGIELIKAKIELSKASATHGVFDFWANGFPVLRRWVIEEHLPMLEESINDTLDKLGMNFALSMKTMKTKKKGDDEYPDFHLGVIDSNGQDRPIATLSKGQSHRVSVSVALALVNQALESSYMNFNILMLDEIMDGLDSSGVLEFCQVLKQFNRKKLLISHDSGFKSLIPSRMIVRYQNDISTVHLDL